MLNIKASHSFTLPLYNEGVNQKNIDFNKEQLLFQEFRKHKDLVETKTSYPVNNHISYDMTLDIIVMSRNEYNKLIQNSNESILK